MPYLPGGTLRDVLTLVKQKPVEQHSGRMMLEAVDAELAKRGETPPTDAVNRQRFAAMTWPETVCWLGVRLAEALESAHRLGVLHRDVKPANVLLGADATPCLADFNVSSCTKVEGAGWPPFLAAASATCLRSNSKPLIPPMPASPPASMSGRPLRPRHHPVGIAHRPPTVSG